MKLTIIIPIYNKIRYLNNLLEQVMGQTYGEFECLLIDDGSTDGSGAVCDVFAEKDVRFRVFHIPNGGVSHARNVGLDAAQGEYITFLDGDDAIESNHLEHLLTCMENSGADLVISGYDKVSHQGVLLQTIVPPITGLVQFRDALCDFARVQRETGLYGCCVSKLFPRKIAEDIRFDEGLKLAEDFDFYLNLYRKIDTVFFSDARTYLYLQEAENSTGATAADRIDYLAQLRINLRYRNMLRHRDVWNGVNKAIVEERLSSYAYFVLFHTHMSQYHEQFEKLYQIHRTEWFPLIPCNILGKWLFFCLRHRQYHAAKLTMTLYRFAGKLLRR